ncbi:Flagellin FlgL [Bosea sp. 62]|uniref:flagellin N-terminal helical domain-containing protein n=1 Tax=unclassified Bosea (in: a-proteobacteria) TaxID=2653178 RepID=UPI001255509F|nr:MULTISPECIES: flagellin [unclassified Bosea (in: a-proteobacteria)]CAD5267683.1 Flagellin FlgL [Bosea sp. 46]CAD5268951.1 Flagellin FlgL [Bosea sp. 7B]CAD5269663.1 Flagellin FlgL [Bosea sp. 21B]VVT62546.1 Flagellin FlgL [Bosea sp. EC-HK365B]VXB97119.1 Flagellin FlgL [Bosea sp. 29B]
MAVSLSAGVRNNLATLQSTAAQSSQIQNRLATGKKVNSAIDSPVNFFTAASLNDRSSQLTGLLDGISNGIQTIQAASKGIDGITKLVGSLQSTIKQAQADAAQNRPTKAGGALANAAEVTATSKSLKDIALDKKIGGADAVADAATATSAGDIGIDTTTNNTAAVFLKSGSTTYTASFDATTTTVRDLVNEINKSGVATAFVDEKGQLNIKGTGSEEVQFGFGVGTDATTSQAAAAGAGNSNAKINFLATDNVAGTGIKGQSITSATRSNLIDQYNDLRNKIDDLAKDAGFNGINLLGGDRLSVVFNEKTGKNQTKLDVQGTQLNSDNLGIIQAGNTQLAGSVNFQNDSDLEAATKSLTGALTSLKSLSSTFGASLSVVQTRQDFTKDMANVLTSGADNLVNADLNQEAASLLALQTRQQLSQQALSLANQADQGVLRLLG